MPWRGRSSRQVAGNRDEKESACEYARGVGHGNRGISADDLVSDRHDYWACFDFPGVAQE